MSILHIFYRITAGLRLAGTHTNQQGRDGGAAPQVDHGQQAGQVALPGARETQPAERERTTCQHKTTFRGDV